MIRIAAKFQLYFPFVLPRADDWDEPVTLGFDMGDYRATLRPRGRCEQLFPDTLDQTMSTMGLSLLRTSQPTSSTRMTVADRCRDRIEVVVESNVDRIEDVFSIDVQRGFEDRAIEATDLFLAHCRVVARCPSVLALEREFRVQDQKFYILNPRTVAWFDAATGARVMAFPEGVNGSISSGAIASPERGSAPMEAIRLAINNGPFPDLSRTLLLDAEAALIAVRNREMLLLAGTACELVSDQYVSRKNGLSMPSVNDAFKSRDSFAMKRYVALPTILSARSLQVDLPDTFDDLERLYRARNSVAHEGRPCYRDGGVEVRVDSGVGLRLLRAANQAVEWLIALF